MQTKRIRLWSQNYTLVSAPSIDRFFSQTRCSFCPFFFFFLFRQLCLYISDSLHLFTLFLTDSLKKCQTKSFENEYSTFCFESISLQLQISIMGFTIYACYQNDMSNFAAYCCSHYVVANIAVAYNIMT